MDRVGRGRDRRLLVAVALVVVALSAGGWYLFGRSSGNACPPGPEQQVRGIVVSVEGTSPTQVTSFTLRTDSGQVITIHIGQLDLTGGFNAGHLREHQSTADPVVAHYRPECDRRVAFRLTDG